MSLIEAHVKYSTQVDEVRFRFIRQSCDEHI
jgi:hypothetical protein